MNSFDDNEIGDAGAIALANALKYNKTLQMLEFVIFKFNSIKFFHRITKFISLKTNFKLDVYLKTTLKIS